MNTPSEFDTDWFEAEKSEAHHQSTLLFTSPSLSDTELTELQTQFNAHVVEGKNAQWLSTAVQWLRDSQVYLIESNSFLGAHYLVQKEKYLLHMAQDAATGMHTQFEQVSTVLQGWFAHSICERVYSRTTFMISLRSSRERPQWVNHRVITSGIAPLPV